MRQIRLFDFLREMDLAYAATDVVISRAGALSISELCLAKKPALLVPSPNVAEDHQTKNAQTLVNENAAILIRDAEAKEKLVECAIGLLYDDKRCSELSANIGRLGKPHAAEDIVNEIEKLLV
jgi:UDP-N-acetylglucosamine--N-acetylmuramyl-(pentapeptide) pyrophosphoryl-undecaprenol N-acetylglucosamine transferase